MGCKGDRKRREKGEWKVEGKMGERGMESGGGNGRKGNGKWRGKWERGKRRRESEGGWEYIQKAYYILLSLFNHMYTEGMCKASLPMNYAHVTKETKMQSTQKTGHLAPTLCTHQRHNILQSRSQ